MSKSRLFLTCVIVAASSAAFAQAPPTPVTPPAQTATPPRGANNCAPTESSPQGNIAPQGTTTGQRTEPLGDKLARSDGVLCPPAGPPRAARGETSGPAPLASRPPPRVWIRQCAHRPRTPATCL